MPQTPDPVSVYEARKRAPLDAARPSTPLGATLSDSKGRGKPFALRPGYEVRVHSRLKEGEKERTQVFEGIVTALHGAGLGKTFTVRRMTAGVGVERIFPVFSPLITKVDVVRATKVRRAKLTYLRKADVQKRRKEDAGLMRKVEAEREAARKAKEEAEAKARAERDAALRQSSEQAEKAAKEAVHPEQSRGTEKAAEEAAETPAEAAKTDDAAGKRPDTTEK